MYLLKEVAASKIELCMQYEVHRGICVGKSCTCSHCERVVRGRVLYVHYVRGSVLQVDMFSELGMCEVVCMCSVEGIILCFF